MSNTINSLNAIYTQQIAEDENRVAITPEDAAAVGQHVRAIKYEARKSGEPLPRAYNTYVSKHNLTATQRRITKEKLGLAEEVEAPIKIKPKEQKEDFIKLSDWRYELREVDMPSTGVTKKKRPITSEKSREKITEKPINNKVEINPTMNQLANSFNHELHAMGGQLLEMVEIKETMVDQIPLSPQELIIQRRMAMLNMRLARKNREKVNKIKKDSPGVVDPAKVAKKPPEEKKVEEEVGISSTEKIQKALKDAALRRKEQQKVAKKKAVKEELSDRAKKEVERDAKNVDNPLYKPGKRTVKQLSYARELALKNQKKKVTKEEVVDEAKVDTGSAEEKATARNKRNTPPGANRKFDTSVFITRKPGESLDSARTRKRRDAHAAKRGVKEEVVDEAAKDQSSKQLDRGMKTTQKAMGVIDNSPYGKLSDDKVDRMNKRLRDRRKDISGEKTRKLTKLLKKEDKAFANVVAALKRKHGDAGVLSSKKDFDDHKKREASKPTAKQIQKKDERTAAQREVDAQYGRTPWNKKGSLGT